MLYITGDTHRRFSRVAAFCAQEKTTKDDVLIILGDVGINFFGAKQDSRIKEYLTALPITLLCVHGNHEKRPYRIFSYEKKPFYGGIAYIEPLYPNIAFAKDAEIYDIEGMSLIAIGGAYSMDKHIRFRRHMKWWPDEQPSEQTKKRVEKKLQSVNWKVDCVLSHTCPFKFIPEEVLPPAMPRSDVSTELWLGKIESKLDYQKWYGGHYHINKEVGKMHFLFDEFLECKVQSNKGPGIAAGGPEEGL